MTQYTHMTVTFFREKRAALGYIHDNPFVSQTALQVRQLGRLDDVTLQHDLPLGEYLS